MDTEKDKLIPAHREYKNLKSFQAEATRTSLKELRLDYEYFLRQRDLPEWEEGGFTEGLHRVGQNRRPPPTINYQPSTICL